MINWRNDPAFVAKAQVDKWFGQTSLGRVFLSQDGRALPIAQAEAEQLRETAEAEVLSFQLRMRQRTCLAIFLVVLLFTAITGMASRFATPWDEVVRKIGYGIYSCHGFWVLYEAWRYEQEVKSVRDRIASTMAMRVPMPSTIAASMTAANPFRASLVGIGAVIFGFYLAAEFMAHRGVDLMFAIPLWLFLLFVPVAWGLYYLGQWFDRNRGVGS